jgi:hypothetical protein
VDKRTPVPARINKGLFTKHHRWVSETAELHLTSFNFLIGRWIHHDSMGMIVSVNFLYGSTQKSYVTMLPEERYLALNAR